jgi:hypothetical protein
MPDTNSIKAGRAYVALSADNSELKQDLDEAEAELRRYGKIADETGQGFYSSLTQSIRSMKRENATSGEKALENVLGGGSQAIAGTVADALGAGAAVIGINFFAEAIKTAAENATKLRAELASGDANMGDLVEKAISSIPVLGEVWQAGRAVREFFTGEKADIERVNRESKLTVDILENQAAAAQKVHKIMLDLAVSTAKVRSETAGIGKDSYTQQRLAIESRMAERSSTSQERDADINSQLSGFDKAVRLHKQKLDSMREAFSGLSDKSPEAFLSQYEASPNKRIWSGHKEQAAISMSQDIRSEMAVLAGLQKSVAEKSKVLNEAHKNDAALQKRDAAELQDIGRRAWEEYAKIMRDGVQSASDEVNNSQVEALRRQGKNLEAARLQIEHEAQKQKAAILQAASDQAKAIGATSILDPRRNGIFAQAFARIEGVMVNARAKLASAGSDDFAFHAGERRDLGGLKADAIPNEYAREKAQIDNKYKYELDGTAGTSPLTKLWMASCGRAPSTMSPPRAWPSDATLAMRCSPSTPPGTQLKSRTFPRAAPKWVFTRLARRRTTKHHSRLTAGSPSRTPRPGHGIAGRRSLVRILTSTSLCI